VFLCVLRESRGALRVQLSISMTLNNRLALYEETPVSSGHVRSPFVQSVCGAFPAMAECVSPVLSARKPAVLGLFVSYRILYPLSGLQNARWVLHGLFAESTNVTFIFSGDGLHDFVPSLAVSSTAE
jgi:hypothetical protein